MGSPAQPVARQVQQVGRVVVHRQAQPAGRRVARAVQRQAPVADLRVEPMTARQVPAVARPGALPVRQAMPRRKRPDKQVAVQPVPRDPTRRAVPTAAVLQRRRAVVLRAQQAPIRVARRRRVTGQRRADLLVVRPVVARPVRRVLVKMERKAAVRRRPVPVLRQAAKRRSSAMTVNRAAARKRIPPVRRERAVQVQRPASRAQVRIPPKAREAKAPVRILPRVRARMPVAVRVRMVRPATVRQGQRPAIRRAAPTAAHRRRCQPVYPVPRVLLRVPRDPMALEARAPRRACQKERAVRAKPAVVTLPAVRRAVEPQAVQQAVEPETVEPPAVRRAEQVAVRAGGR